MKHTPLLVFKESPDGQEAGLVHECPGPAESEAGSQTGWGWGHVELPRNEIFALFAHRSVS